MGNFFSRLSINGNWIDIIFVLLILYFIITHKGFIVSLMELASFVLALYFSYLLYPMVSTVLIHNFTLTKGMAQASAFFIAWFLVEFILYILFTLLASKIPKLVHENKINRYTGIIPAAIQGMLIFLFFISLVFALPVKGQIKQAILDSKSGPFFVNISQGLELRAKNVFGEAASETINFLTIKPKSDETVQLDKRVSAAQLSIDSKSEQIMLASVNKERAQRGFSQLVLDPRLRAVARSYGKVMFINGFFSHISQVDGSSPGERATDAGVEYTILGENLAYAPDVYLAHQGLMNSPGHRANILSTDYSRVGVGVIDGGIYGKMFVQEFAN